MDRGEVMREKKSRANMVVIILALLAVVGMIVLLVVLQKHQDEQSQLLQQQGQQLTEQREEEKREKTAEQMIRLSRMEEGSVYLRNTGDTSVNVDGFSLCVDGVEVRRFSGETVLKPSEEIEISLRDADYSENNSVVALYKANGELLAQRVLSSLVVADHCPVFSIPSGFYSEELTLEISAPEGTEVYYTCDGTVPTTESLRYEGPISIAGSLGKKPVYAAESGISIGYNPPSEVDKCTVVQAISVDAEGIESEIVSAVYFCRIDEKLSYKNIPVISINADPVDLFDYYTGIYVSGRTYEDALARGESTQGVGNYSMGWSVVADMKYFETNRGMTYDAKVLCKVIADEAVSTAQKNIQISVYETQAGESSSLYAYLPAADSVMILDKGGTDYVLKARQMVAGSLLADSSFMVTEVSPCALFLNGEFWGVYLMKTADMASAISDKYNVAREDVEIIDSGKMQEKLQPEENAAVPDSVNSETQEPDTGKLSAGELDFYELCRFIVRNDMTVSQNYEYVSQKMSIESYAEYVCANLYMANNGWNESCLVWRCREGARETESNLKWHFILDSCDRSMAVDSYSSYSIDTFLRPEVSGSEMLKALMCNEEFAQTFADTMNRMIQTYFTEEKVAAAVDEVSAAYKKCMIASQNRYSQNLSESAYESRMEDIKEFCRQRSDFILKYTLEFMEMDREND